VLVAVSHRDELSMTIALRADTSFRKVRDEWNMAASTRDVCANPDRIPDDNCAALFLRAFIITLDSKSQ
jgi:hypothetical protein